MPIGDVDPIYLDSQEDFFYCCTDTSYEESYEDSSEDDYIDEENDCALEDMLFPPEMLHSMQSLCPPKRRRCRGGTSNGVREDVRDNLPGDIDVQAGSMELPYGDEEPLDCAGSVSFDPNFGARSGGPDQWTGNGWAGNGIVEMGGEMAGVGMAAEMA
jgi:hypothetical protein